MKEPKRKIIDFRGMVLFFLLIACVCQISVLTYEYISERTENNLLIAVLILILIFILSAICVLFDAIRRKVTVVAPTNKILDATNKIATGDFNVRLKVEHAPEKYNEYDLIMLNLNTMVAELSKMEILKSDFISNVSHEIKTPLSVIQNYVTLLQNKELSDEQKEKYIKTVLHATRRLNSLITNVLKLNKLENQQIKSEKKNFNLTASLEECILSFEELIESKRITLDCNLDEVTVCSNEELLEIVWSNLISNAIKFTSPEGKIEISLKKSGYSAIIIISDNGIGISPEVGSRIFEKFYQADGSRSQEGNGLGLALVKKVIDILGGQISVTSEVGKGSTFTVTLKNVIKN